MPLRITSTQKYDQIKWTLSVSTGNMRPGHRTKEIKAKKILIGGEIAFQMACHRWSLGQISILWNHWVRSDWILFKLYTNKHERLSLTKSLALVSTFTKDDWNAEDFPRCSYKWSAGTVKIWMIVFQFVSFHRRWTKRCEYWPQPNLLTFHLN